MPLNDWGGMVTVSVTLFLHLWQIRRDLNAVIQSNLKTKIVEGISRLA